MASKKIDRTLFSPAETGHFLLDNFSTVFGEGIVAVLDAATEQSIVNFDGLGHARLRAVTPALTPSPQPATHSPG